MALTPACNKKDPAACEQAQQTIRQALDREQFQAITPWREYAWRQCEDRTALAALDQKIVARQNEVQARNRAAEARRSETAQLLRVFLSWVAETRAAPDRATATPVCDPPAPNDPEKEKSKQRMCTASRTVQGPSGMRPLSVRYFAAEPTAARFIINLPDATSCEELGAIKSKTWQVATTSGSTTARFSCDFTSGPLSGMRAVLSQAVNADLHVFNPTYLDKEPQYRAILDSP
ncbi:MAG TPA: hypothetical protein VFQ61_23635 [Polyangiaceae bacterium]|nr:hypothetical protein [Polyangiaceae bacterium]